MPLVLLALRLVAGVLSSSDDPQLQRWAGRVEACVERGDVAVLAAGEATGVLAFSCGEGSRRLVVMANRSAQPQRIPREPPVVPLVPVFATNGDVGAVPSLLITLFEAGGVVYSNEIPPHTTVVFRPAEPDDVRPRGLEE